MSENKKVDLDQIAAQMQENARILADKRESERLIISELDSEIKSIRRRNGYLATKQEQQHLALKRLQAREVVQFGFNAIIALILLCIVLR